MPGVGFSRASSWRPPRQRTTAPASYDVTREIAVTGVVTEWRWTNPHVWIYLSVGVGTALRHGMAKGHH